MMPSYSYRFNPHFGFVLWLVSCLILISCSDKKHSSGLNQHISKRYNNLAEQHLESDPDSVLYYTNRALEAGKVLGSHLHDRKAYYLQAAANRYKGNLEHALAASLRALSETSHPAGDSLEAEIRFLLAQIFTELGQYDEALRELNSARNIFQQFEHPIGIGKCLNCISLIYYRINDLAKGKEYNDNALDIWKVQGYPLGLASSHTINGYLYAAQEDYASAIKELELAKEIYKNISDKVRYANTLLNIGEVYLKKGDFQKAENYFKESLSLSRDLNFAQVYVDGLNKLGQSFTRQKRFELAIDTLKAGLEQALAIKDRAMLAEFYKHLAEVYFEAGDYKEAFTFQRKQEQEKDSIFKKERALRIAEFEVLYQTEKMQQQNRLLKEKNERRLLYVLFLTILISLISAVILLLYSRYRIRLKYLNQQRELNEQTIRQQHLENEKLEAETKLKAEENTKLQLEIEHKQKELSSVTLHLYQKSESLGKLLEEIEQLQKEATLKDQKDGLKKLRRSINRSLQLDEDWSRFKMHFDQVHYGFFEKLAASFPALTDQDLRHCAYIKMNLSTKEISRLMNINPTSVQKARVRLKKKLRLNKEEHLFDFIRAY